MGQTKQERLANSEILSASEIGQYHYCSMAWYLQKSGYKPQSHMLEVGAKKHVEIGNILDSTQSKVKTSRVLAIVGYLLIAFTILLILIGVIS